ncbi:hypothetical protein JTE90_016342 [Oedothorax gibbosus]|uniref:Uncharacterized protein n=1 Tax=Oedothorax gibbosus TaxID=931172 RepID=A0AAV6TR65_9ARAC|nr:hypothetical protein JTE90_016342 [Oedothorax gibbosus]
MRNEEGNAESVSASAKTAAQAVRETQAALTSEELEYLATLDSTYFGFLRLNKSENVKKKTLVIKAIKVLERVLVTRLQKAENTKETEDKQIDTLSEKISEIQTEDGTQTESPPIQPTKDDKTEVVQADTVTMEVQCQIYLKLGHLNLLLEDYPKG